MAEDDARVKLRAPAWTDTVVTRDNTHYALDGNGHITVHPWHVDELLRRWEEGFSRLPSDPVVQAAQTGTTVEDASTNKASKK